ncbi:septum formation inhibitor Maf [Ameyamaea chiangmaiensis NBRC 103196]|uniref:Septum formation initiator family protein n=1 Tax=Ameyamaea chiangmaiensis TaxID=442969 RepID=A0A850P7A9_9PROT|nr:septum formation initiator family protein [Ameyamaea chiangmaiensis]MBS4073714.1 septum formation initiator family protein [Ameyamaea chiangmaiensis]NVN39794.1 septum formation initiator family protein [Ameyamaea chiangmaiensis]GBQ68720.1 septum formation inhibitor Maf [Ameyamaea chiangmaiensis NBRC 103196]
MQIGRLVRRFFNATVPPALFLGLAGYFGWNALQGDHGLRSYAQQLKLLDQAKQSQQDALSERTIWNRRVAALQENALDADMVDERGRAMLNLAHDRDLVVPYGPHDKLY